MSLKKILICILILNIAFISRAFSQTNIDKLRVKVQSIDFVEENQSFIFKIFADKSLIYTSYSDENPYKLTVEFPVIDFGNFTGTKEINQGVIKSYKVTQLGRQENFTGKIEIIFNKKPEFSIERLSQGVAISIKKEDLEPARQEVALEPVTVNNIIYSGDLSRFVVIFETSGKAEALSYVLKAPLRLVLDIQSAKYQLKDKFFNVKNGLIRSIRVEPYPNLTRVFLDINADKMPLFVTRAESDKLVVELSTEVLEKKEEKPRYLTLDNVDFIPEPSKNVFRFKNIYDADYKTYKLSDLIYVFEFKMVRLAKSIEKTYDTKEVSNLLNSFTLYQVKPEEENRVRFVAMLKEPLSYKTEKVGSDIVIQFSKERELVTPKEKTKEIVKAEPPIPAAPPAVPVVKKEEPKVEIVKAEEKKEEVKPEPRPVEKTELEVKKAEEKVKPVAEEKPLPAPVVEEKKEEPKIKEITVEKKEEPRVAEKTREIIIKPEEKKEPEKKIEMKKQEKTVQTVVTIKPREEEPVATEQKIKQAVDSKYKGRPITINLKDAEIQHIFKLLTEVAKLDGEILNIVTSEDVRGKLSIQLEEVPWDQVMDVVMEVNNLGMKRIGNIIRVMPKDRLKKEQEDLLAASKIREKVENLVLEIVPINYAEAADFVDKIKPLLSQRGSVTIDKRNNSLIINDLKDNIDEAKRLIVKLDTPPQQVVIEARVVEASSDFSKEMGIQWGVKLAQTVNNRFRMGLSGPSARGTDIAGTPTFNTGVGGTAALDLTGTGVQPTPYFVNLPAAIGSGAGGGINFALVNLRSGAGLDIQLSAMENKGVGKILSRPKITTLNNIEANIQQGSSIPYETLSDKGTQTQFIDATLQLTVTPRITPDNSIILKVKVSNNNPNTAIRSAGGVPSIDKNEATTEILVRDGQTIVIGGIIRNKETVSKGGVPFLMDIPVIGWLFKKEAKSVENRELLIFLTPSIIRQIKEVEAS